LEFINAFLEQIWFRFGTVPRPRIMRTQRPIFPRSPHCTGSLAPGKRAFFTSFLPRPAQPYSPLILSGPAIRPIRPIRPILLFGRGVTAKTTAWKMGLYTIPP